MGVATQTTKVPNIVADRVRGGGVWWVWVEGVEVWPAVVVWVVAAAVVECRCEMKAGRLEGLGRRAGTCPP